MADDGRPADPELRRLFGHLKGAASSINGWGLDEHLVATRFRKDDREKAMALIAALRKLGLVAQGANGRWTVVTPAREAPTDPESRRRNYEALVRGVAERFSDDPAVREKAGRAFVELRTIYGLHRFDADGRRAILVPTRVEWTSAGPRPAGGLVLKDDFGGISAWEIGREALAFPKHDPIPAPDMAFAEPWADQTLIEKLGRTAISPFADSALDFGVEIGRLARLALSSAMSQSEAAPAFLGGFDVDRWAGFRQSVLAARRLNATVRPVLWSILDPETRRIASAVPKATYAIYAWYRASDPRTSLRRQQAGRAYPLFSNRIPEVGAVVDAGEPLAPAIGALLALPQSAVRRLQGVTRQRLGPVYHDFISPRSLYLAIAGRASVDLLPPPKEWHRLEPISRIFGDLPHTVLRQGLVDKALRDPQRFAMRFDGFPDAFRDLFERVVCIARRSWNRPLENGGWMGTPTLDWLADELMHEISGQHGSLKSIERFNRLWHRRLLSRNTLVRRIRRQAVGTRALEWPAPTSEPFVCQAGRLDWLTDEDQLELEGIEMSHCVGTYADRCVTGASFIASIVSIDGGRSTVEYVLAPGKRRRLRIAQNQAAGNVVPTIGCRTVAEAFLDHSRRRGVLSRGALGSRPHPGRQEYNVPMADEEADALLATYADCMPTIRSFLDRSAARIVRST